ncbi:MAG: hypothetical protein WBF71_16950 [Microthrixaceae bacterium]
MAGGLGLILAVSCGNASEIVESSEGAEAIVHDSDGSVESSDIALAETVNHLKLTFGQAGYNVDSAIPGSVEDWLSVCPNAVTATVVSAKRGEDTISDLTALAQEVRDPEAGEQITGWIELRLDVTASEGEPPRIDTVLLPFAHAGVFVDDKRSLEDSTEHAGGELDRAWQSFAELKFDGLRLALCVTDAALALERVYDGVPMMDAVATRDDAPVVALSESLDDTFTGISFRDLQAAIRG